MKAKRQSHILIADDQEHILDTLTILLEGEGFQVTAVKALDEIIEHCRTSYFDLALLDMNYTQDTTSGQEGLLLLKRIREIDETIPIVLMTAWASIELSVEAIKAGASDFIEKPWKINRLLSVINNQLSLARERRANQRLNALVCEPESIPDLIVQSKVMQPVMKLIQRTSASDANILLTGESGVGKSHIAKSIHRLSHRSDRPLVKVNMGAIAESLFESELFGHAKGAYTDAKEKRIGRFEMADEGTLFLDEIANIPKALQGKLLRILESGEFEVLGSSHTRCVDVRIISASNVNFEEEINKGNFRQDLFYRLNTITIHIPPLRERKEDIPLLVDFFINKYQRKYRREGIVVDKKAMQSLIDFPWYGNVRELEHTMERAMLMASSQVIGINDLGLQKYTRRENLEDMTFEQAEILLIKNAIAKFSGNILAAAESLGVSRAALYRRMEKYQIQTNSEI
ncbi:sigma-54-dependent transcriptional regulator [Aliikangiella coralliicola]|uniref:Sigma-54-dependent Fis family transcriptional regulator n=1 Tax=Aliikangiella coralliicola TaxID=2592383 RepID=A0A545UGH0_9GAMM|nr:sigma-54 dependent transcriptional regulator [Aliikangiella coralliicola]TQV88557.1 sigma-54-dependent Fis family transcriptional regulator [Aliikangiella coralliicola]